MTLQQLRGLDPENVGKLFDRIKRSRIDLPFKCRNVGPIDACKVRQSLLRQLSLPSNPAQVNREGLPQRHAVKLTLAMTLHPRSILYKIFGDCGAGIRWDF